MPEEKYETLYLDIAGETVEQIRVFGKTDEEKQIKGLLSAYHLSPGMDYVFYYKRTSKMNDSETIQNMQVRKGK